jgi:hypothetical protein
MLKRAFPIFTSLSVFRLRQKPSISPRFMLSFDSSQSRRAVSVGGN